MTDGKRLFVHYGAQGTACLTLDGDIVWKNDELNYPMNHGNGGSPVLVSGNDDDGPGTDSLLQGIAIAQDDVYVVRAKPWSTETGR